MNKLILLTNIKTADTNKQGAWNEQINRNMTQHDAAAIPFSGAGFYGVETGALCVGSSALLKKTAHGDMDVGKIHKNWTDEHFNIDNHLLR